MEVLQQSVFHDRLKTEKLL